MRIGRFEVMATLQAARAFCLGKSLIESKSFGLNRAIFYAAAKRGFKVKVKNGEFRERKFKKLEKEHILTDKIGDEEAFYVEIEGKKYYVIGGEILTEKIFEKQIEKKFKSKWNIFFEEALDILRSFEKDNLLSQRKFYEKIYKPLRDKLVVKWNEKLKEI
ncbi:MAG: hypothetical protein ABDH37_06470 [Candidatus Hydrothermales bacterium]